MANPATRPAMGWLPTVWPFKTTLGPSGSQLRAPGTNGAAGAPNGRARAAATATAFRRLYSSRVSLQTVGAAGASTAALSCRRLLMAIGLLPGSADPRGTSGGEAVSLLG